MKIDFLEKNMKNIVVVLLSSIVFILSAQANPATYKANDKIANPPHVVKNKVEKKKNRATKSQKKKIDITVKKDRKPRDNPVNWANKKKPRDVKDHKGANRRNPNKGHEKANKDFHKWSNKTKDSIESRLRKKDHNHQSVDPFFNERHQ